MFHHSNGTDAPGARSVLGVALALGTLAVAAAAFWAGHVEASSSGMSCRIDIKKYSGTAMLEGVVVSKSAIAGHYDLVVTKSGGGGSSDINQSGSFEAAPSRETSLGTVTLGGDAGRYKARLTAKVGGGTIECRDSATGAL